MEYGRFDDESRAYVVTTPTTPMPWINYLGNRRLQAFISQQAGGMMWYLEPESRRLTRYQYVGSPADRPGFYLYVKDNRTGTVWNPHFAPTCTPLDKYECRHSPGVTGFCSEKDGIRAAVDYVIPLEDNVLIWRAKVTNNSGRPADLVLANYIEFGIMEFMRELWWCYLQRHFDLSFDRKSQCIRYDYHVFEAAYAPKIVVACSEPVAGWECSRDAFLGRAGSLENPDALKAPRGFTNSELPIGGHACGVLGTALKLKPGEEKSLAWVFAMADDFDQADALAAKYRDPAAADSAIAAQRAFWEERLGTIRADTGDEMVDRFVNTWNGYQALTLSGLPCSISTEHIGIDGLRYRDTTQYALAAANLDPAWVAERMAMVFASQKKDGMGCYIFWPYTKKPASDALRRSDNTVWQVYTVKNLVEETGDLAYLDRQIPFRDGGSGSVYEHTLLGLKYLWDHRGPAGLPLMYYADWNDCLVHWQSDVTESVMLGMQLGHSFRQFAELAGRIGRGGDAAWCIQAADELDRIVNSDKVWDGRWYRRLMLPDGKFLGGESDIEGQIWINPQTWAVICGAGRFQGRGEIAMDAVHEFLDSPIGLVKQHPAIGSTGQLAGRKDKPGTAPGIGENGGIFNHTNTWAIMAEAMLGHNERAFEYYRRCIPAVVSGRFGADHYLREPYVYVSAVVGPINKMFGQGGISWITGTSSWMYVAATQYILGIRPTLDGLAVRPCLPAAMKSVRVRRRFRGCEYDIRIDNASRGRTRLEVFGEPIDSQVVPAQTGATCEVRCFC